MDNFIFQFTVKLHINILTQFVWRVAPPCGPYIELFEPSFNSWTLTSTFLSFSGQSYTRPVMLNHVLEVLATALATEARTYRIPLWRGERFFGMTSPVYQKHLKAKFIVSTFVDASLNLRAVLFNPISPETQLFIIFHLSALILNLTIKCFTMLFSGQPGLQVEHKAIWHSCIHSFFFVQIFKKNVACHRKR